MCRKVLKGGIAPFSDPTLAVRFRLDFPESGVYHRQLAPNLTSMRTIDPENPLASNSDLIEDALKVLAEIEGPMKAIAVRREYRYL